MHVQHIQRSVQRSALMCKWMKGMWRNVQRNQIIVQNSLINEQECATWSEDFLWMCIHVQDNEMNVRHSANSQRFWGVWSEFSLFPLLRLFAQTPLCDVGLPSSSDTNERQALWWKSESEHVIRPRAAGIPQNTAQCLQEVNDCSAPSGCQIALYLTGCHNSEERHGKASLFGFGPKLGLGKVTEGRLVLWACLYKYWHFLNHFEC